MSTVAAKEEWKELIGILKDVEKKVLLPQNNGKGSHPTFEPCIEALEAFQCRAVELGISEVQQAARFLKQYAEEQNGSDLGAESLGVFSFGVNALLEQMDRLQSGREASGICVDEVMEILGMTDPHGVVDSISSEDLPLDPPAANDPEVAGGDEGLGSGGFSSLEAVSV
ncbi:MAG: hypothetical protein HGA63_09225, partial [Syntrophobacteraceae bacterium]|nr:hypothetical protein [Syntrophobacteraceae bacterium]